MSLVTDEGTYVVQAGGIEKELPETHGILHDTCRDELAADHVGIPDDRFLMAGVAAAAHG